MDSTNIKQVNVITGSQFFVRLKLCSPLLFIGVHSHCFSRPVNSHTFLTSNCLKDPSVSVPLAIPGELRQMIQHDRPTFSNSASENLTASFVPKQHRKLCPGRIETHPGLYFREEADSRKEVAINILTGGFWSRRELVKT
jgi:hypothetical protein